jgi:hypothetical protein
MDNTNDVNHKILFFFMPKNIVFAKKEPQDTDAVSALKAVSPCFYWCSGHEFLTTHSENKFLIQHQVYFINGNSLEPASVIQDWSKSKHEIRNSLFSFLEMWSLDHEKVLLTPENKLSTTENITDLQYLNKVYNFADYASFVAESIFSLKNAYIEQARFMNFENMQKEFWKNVALNPQASNDIRKFLNINTDIAINNVNNKKESKSNVKRSKRKTKSSK